MGNQILIVDDDVDLLETFKDSLTLRGYDVITAFDGQEAIKQYNENEPCITFMDIKMPVMDGYAATKEIRKWEKYKSMETTPVIALTAHAMKEHEQKSIEAGCNDHVIKPIKKARLMETINKYNRGK